MAEAQNETQGKKHKFELSEGLIIAAFPILAYLVTFVFESGYASAFDIPRDFIALSWTTVFVVSAALCGLAGFLLNVANFAIMFLSVSSSPIARRLKRLFFGYLYLTAMAYLYHENRTYFLGFCGAMVILTLLEFVPPLITQRGKGSYLQKLEAQEQQRKQADDQVKTIFDKAIETLGGKATLALFSSWILLFLAYHAGLSTAQRQSKFLITNTLPEMAVLRIYGDKMVCVPFDRNTGEIEPSFVVLKVAEDLGLTLHLEKVGPLSLVEETSSQITSPLPTPSPSPSSTATPTSP